MAKSGNKKVMLGLSGGVDSAVSAVLLLEQGFEVIGVTFVFACRSEKARDDMVNDARLLASYLGIEHIVHEASEEFAEKIMTPFVDAWRRGETPNPCVLCNPEMKFPSIIKLADEYNCDFISTGHYAAIGDEEGKIIPLSEREKGQQVTLLRGSDRAKDQSYFLYALPQEILSRVLFPLGELSKVEVRALAADREIDLAGKTDSQEICFLPDDDRIEFLREQDALGEPGPYIDVEGNVIGRHAGIGRYTVGQRKKLGQSFGKRMTILKIDAAGNTIVLGDEKQCRTSSILVGNFISSKLLNNMFESRNKVYAQVQLRSQASAVPCTIELLDDKSQAVVSFTEEQRLTAPGQSAVFYKENIVLGGALLLSSTLD